jgi:hypothetical protein
MDGTEKPLMLPSTCSVVSMISLRARRWTSGKPSTARVKLKGIHRVKMSSEPAMPARARDSSAFKQATKTGIEIAPVEIEPNGKIVEVSMRVRLKGLNSKRKRLADGSFRTYWYAWKGGPPLRGEPGTPEFIASFNAAAATKIAPPSGVLLALLFQFQDSAEFQFGISPRTRKDYIKQIKRIERVRRFSD